MPPCGCRTGCQHRDHPDQPAQRECRAGIVPTGPSARVVQLERVAEAARALLVPADAFSSSRYAAALRQALADLDAPPEPPAADSLTTSPPSPARTT